ncbi:NAD(+) diphosphatase [Desnuesiella massiliensis]|uniref:NAD(+) diphosphatase n=1 Tax=Desnuesiella massiliensis TaxID=1650662 RepID=UPI0006E24C7C|nr:NAD(+) diphosphatase [Desnuesiella massiliensis]
MSNHENYVDFISAVEEILPKTEQDLYFLFCNDELLIILQQEKAIIPKKKDLEGMNLYNLQYLGLLNGQNCFCGELYKDEILPKNMRLIKLRPLMSLIEEDMFWLVGRAIQIVNWNKDHKYCGRCGTLTENLEDERAKKCPKCGFINYPRISPAIIVAVVKEDKLLLAHNNQAPEGMYSVLAGFVEPGETFEECVVREVFEETGIKVKNIRYFGSQPWPFPNSMMIGFTAEYAEGEIQVDGKEIGHADWYLSNALPLTRRSISISTKLIDWFKENY